MSATTNLSLPIKINAILVFKKQKGDTISHKILNIDTLSPLLPQHPLNVSTPK
ncbi:hypothetical protein NIES3974_47370 [Calothrix sp. NIES-3974]|nr:hypothetical protein NIES3974_47370 [Calothrix sp. NIES-3974]